MGIDNKLWAGSSVGLMTALLAGGVQAETDEARIERLEQQVDDLSQALEEYAVQETEEAEGGGLLERVSIGGYGSIRGEVTDLESQQNTFTFRRFVLTTDAQISDRLQAYVELEFERFAELELEKDIASEDDEFEAVQTVEGTDGSEIAIEQAWARYAIDPALNLQAGAVLVPIGRFNIYHDDNQHNFTRRPLVDTGAPVLPVAAAYPELGVGATGSFAVGGGSLIDYRFYVVNGAQLDLEFEQEVVSEQGEAPETVSEAEFEIARGTFSEDLNDNKALTGRLAYRFSPAHEIAISGYWGRYTPEFLTDADVYSIGLDGAHNLGGLELEYEAVYTAYEDVEEVAGSFATGAFNQEGESAEVTIGDDTLADSRAGYWVTLRYPFWPEALDGTFLEEGFANPTLEPSARFEQVFFDGQLRGLEFSGGSVTELDQVSATLNRATLGLAYRPVPQWVVTVAGEYTWTNRDSLAGLTNFIAAEEDEDDAFALTAGVAFGF